MDQVFKSIFITVGLSSNLKVSDCSLLSQTLPNLITIV